MTKSDPALPASAWKSRAEHCARRVDDLLTRFVDDLALAEQLAEPIRYALLSGGKRIRPMLAWLCCEALGADPEASLPAGASVELVHAFSLVHDDLPAIDNDDLRRGRPALHVHAGEADAILAGDAMLSLAFHLLGREVRDPALCARLVAELASAATAMIDGQVLDTAADAGAQVDDPAAHLARIHASKTGALIVASCRMGAFSAFHALGRDDDDALERVTSLGRCVGLMFQIVDDLLDVEQSTEAIGKTAGADAAAGKLTYPAVHGVAASRAEIARLREESLALLAPFGDDAAALVDFVDYLASRTS